MTRSSTGSGTVEDWGWMRMRQVDVGEASRPKGLEQILDGVEYVAVAIEVLAIVIIVLATVGASWTYVNHRLRGLDPKVGYQSYRAQLGSGLLLGLEVLVAADVIRTVALEQTLESVTTLAVLVLIRIVLGWSIVVEIERRWPWQQPGDERVES